MRCHARTGLITPRLALIVRSHAALTRVPDGCGACRTLAADGGKR